MELCPRCNTPLASDAKQCGDCGHSLAAAGEQTEYRLMIIAGIAVLIAGAVSAHAEARIAAAISVAVGTAILVAGLVGSWWNRE